MYLELIIKLTYNYISNTKYNLCLVKKKAEKKNTQTLKLMPGIMSDKNDHL